MVAWYYYKWKCLGVRIRVDVSCGSAQLISLLNFPYGNVLCEARRVVWLECEEFCSKSVDRPRIKTEGGSQLTVNSQVVICRWRGRGGGVDRQSSQRGSAERLKFVGGEGGEGRGVNWQSTRRGSAERLKFVGGEGGEGGQSAFNSERICREVEICRLGGRGGQLTVNFGRICKHFGRITSENLDSGGINRQSTQEGSAKTYRGSAKT